MSRDRLLCSYHGHCDDGFDVSDVARAFGGGGHRAAAGFTVDKPVHYHTRKF